MLHNHGAPADPDGWRRENRLLRTRCNDLTARVHELEQENAQLREEAAERRSRFPVWWRG